MSCVKIELTFCEKFSFQIAYVVAQNDEKPQIANIFNIGIVTKRLILTEPKKIANNLHDYKPLKNIMEIVHK